METKNILSLIPGCGGLFLKALDGSRLIYKSKKTFLSLLDNDFQNWGLIKKGIPTPEIPINVHEMIANSTFLDIFSSLPGPWKQKWLSQHQVIEFCETLPQWLRQDGYGTFFLIKKDENLPIDENNPIANLVVVDVCVNSNGLIVDVYRLENDRVWDGQDRRRVVSPKLMPSGA